MVVALGMAPEGTVLVDMAQVQGIDMVDRAASEKEEIPLGHLVAVVDPEDWGHQLVVEVV